MTQSAFDSLYEAVPDSDRLKAAYDDVLNDLFRIPLWTTGPIERHRILWKHAEQARVEDREAFRSPGLYFWGVEERPLYLGITGTTFGSRFSRYIWQERSQCKLAQTYASDLVVKGVDGFPAEIMEWYGRSFPGSKVRLVGAVRFAKEGIEKIWFALFPHAKGEQIRELERALIPVAARWNEDRGLPPLLNIQQ